ncbi:MAG: carboxymuconolactone decarboxylase family protein [Gaiellaceae bacterium]
MTLSSTPDDALAHAVTEGGLRMEHHQTTLAKLAIADNVYYKTLLARESSNVTESHLSEKTHALVRLGALVGTDAASPGYMWAVESARRQGATADEIVGCLVAALPAVGVARIVSAAPKLALALGWDVSSAFEDNAAEPQD